jgi:hypothetical protein
VPHGNLQLGGKGLAWRRAARPISTAAKL